MQFLSWWKLSKLCLSFGLVSSLSPPALPKVVLLFLEGNLLYLHNVNFKPVDGANQQHYKASQEMLVFGIAIPALMKKQHKLFD